MTENPPARVPDALIHHIYTAAIGSELPDNATDPLDPDLYSFVGTAAHVQTGEVPYAMGVTPRRIVVIDIFGDQWKIRGVAPRTRHRITADEAGPTLTLSAEGGAYWLTRYTSGDAPDALLDLAGDAAPAGSVVGAVALPIYVMAADQTLTCIGEINVPMRGRIPAGGAATIDLIVDLSADDVDGERIEWGPPGTLGGRPDDDQADDDEDSPGAILVRELLTEGIKSVVELLGRLRVAEEAVNDHTRWVPRTDYDTAAETVALMHAAAVGEVRGPRRGVVEDVEDLRASRDEMRRALDASDRALAAAKAFAERLTTSPITAPECAERAAATLRAAPPGGSDLATGAANSAAILSDAWTRLGVALAIHTPLNRTAEGDQ
jgi:hypothetical protein